MAGSSPSEAQDPIKKLLITYEVSLNTSNLPLAMSLYTADAVFMAPHSPPSVGKDNIEAAYTQLFSTIDHIVNITVDESQVLSAEGWAMARTTCSGYRRAKATGKEEPDAVQGLWILKQVAGEWKIARYAFSSTAW